MLKTSAPTVLHERSLSEIITTETLTMLFAFFGLGWAEIIVLGLACAVPVAAVAIILPIVLLMGRGSSSREAKGRNQTHDSTDE
jgi:hypothetical protein